MNRPDSYTLRRPLLALATVALVGSACWCFAQDKKPEGQPPAQPAAPAAEQPPAEPPKNLPAAKDVIEKHIKAMGGREAILKHTSKVVKGTVSAQMGGDMQMEVHGAKPNRIYQRVSMGSMEVTSGFDGKVAWTNNPMMGGAMVLEDEDAESLKEQAEFYDELKDLTKYSKVETVDSTDFEGHTCYKVRLVKGEGEKAEETFEFYDTETGLQAGQTSERTSPMGKFPVTMVTQEYKEFGGVKSPTKMVVKATVMGQPMEQAITITSIEYDKVDEKVFELPEEIKELLKEKEAGDKPAPGTDKPAEPPRPVTPEQPAGGEPKPKP